MGLLSRLGAGHDLGPSNLSSVRDVLFSSGFKQTNIRVCKSAENSFDRHRAQGATATLHGSPVALTNKANPSLTENTTRAESF